MVTAGSRGIGRAVALLAGSMGWSVGIGYRDDRAAAEAVVERIATAGGRAVATAGDVAVEADVRQPCGSGRPASTSIYAPTKGAVDTLSLGLAREMAADGVRVNAVRPGVIETDIHASSGRPDRPALLAPLIPLGRAGTADEVAQAIVWLPSDAASYTTGALLDVSGGR